MHEKTVRKHYVLFQIPWTQNVLSWQLEVFCLPTSQSPQSHLLGSGHVLRSHAAFLLIKTTSKTVQEEKLSPASPSSTSPPCLFPGTPQASCPTSTSMLILVPGAAMLASRLVWAVLSLDFLGAGALCCLSRTSRASWELCLVHSNQRSGGVWLLVFFRCMLRTGDTRGCKINLSIFPELQISYLRKLFFAENVN